MSQNAAIDVAIGLILMYLMLSLLCTVINEFIATKLRLRAKSLASALEKLLDNPALRDKFYGHGLIVGNKLATATGPQSTISATVSGVAGVGRGIARIASVARNKIRGLNLLPPAPPAIPPALAGAAPAGVGPAAGAPAPVGGPALAPDKDHPSYLSGRTVALALIASLDPTKSLPGIADLQIAAQGLPASRIRDTLLSSLTEAGGDIDGLRTSIATWFDDSMERLSGAYKRQLKWISMLVGLIVAVVFNADSLNVATTLWSDQDRRASVAAMATTVAQESASQTPESVDAAKLQEAIWKTENTLHSLPIAWNCVVKPTTGASSPTQEVALNYWDCAMTKLPTVTLMQVLGWMLTTTALTLGAPFWFDLLQKFVNIRGAGTKPKREDEKATA